MARKVIRGLTWGHRRASVPLENAARAFIAANPDTEIVWTVRSLADFEHQNFAEAIAGTDLIVFDHPHLGQAISENALLPLDGQLPADGERDDAYIGPSLRSYRHDGQLWAVPVDAATIHAVYRPDLMDRLGADLPLRWDDAIALCQLARHKGFRTLLAAHGHHALLTLASLMNGLGAPWPTESGKRFHLDAPVLAEAIGQFQDMLAQTDMAVSLQSTAITLHDRLAEDDDLVFCPATYGYATYGEQGVYANRLAFSPFPGLGSDPSAGTAIGGAGCGISRQVRERDAALDFLAFLSRGDTQVDLLGREGGQPARIEAWTTPQTDRRFNGFFSAVRQTLRGAWVRPRFPGYTELEQDLAALLQSCLRGQTSRNACVSVMLDRAERVRVLP